MHLYADDTYVYVAFKSKSFQGAVVKRLDVCIKELKDWMTMNYLKFNDEKTEYLFLVSKHQLVTTRDIQIGERVIQPSTLGMQQWCSV